MTTYVNKRNPLIEDVYEIIDDTTYGFYKKDIELSEAMIAKIAKATGDYMQVQHFLRQLYNTHPTQREHVPVPDILIKEVTRGNSKKQSTSS